MPPKIKDHGELPRQEFDFDNGLTLSKPKETLVDLSDVRELEIDSFPVVRGSEIKGGLGEQEETVVLIINNIARLLGGCKRLNVYNNPDIYVLTTDEKEALSTVGKTRDNLIALEEVAEKLIGSEQNDIRVLELEENDDSEDLVIKVKNINNESEEIKKSLVELILSIVQTGKSVSSDDELLQKIYLLIPPEADKQDIFLRSLLQPVP